MREIVAPETFVRGIHCPKVNLSEMKIFLAGSIENGEAEDWQSKVVKRFSGYQNVVFLNPRRKTWDPTLDHGSQEFQTQVKWELEHLYLADVVLFYFQPGTNSMVSLLELGLLLGLRANVIICCSPEYKRSANVRILCEYLRSQGTLKAKLYEEWDTWISAVGEVIRGVSSRKFTVEGYWVEIESVLFSEGQYRVTIFKGEGVFDEVCKTNDIVDSPEEALGMVVQRSRELGLDYKKMLEPAVVYFPLKKGETGK